MKTDQLIEILSTNLEPVKRGRVEKILACALLIGGVAAFCLMLTTIGPRADISGSLAFIALKLSLTVSLIVAGSVLLLKSMRPGQPVRTLFVLALLPLLGFGLAGVMALARSGSWDSLFSGTEWATCVLCIPLFAVVPYAALIWALRQAAPTSLKRAGAIAGLVAGALGATAYAFHCTDDSLLFVGVWYTVLIVFCGFVGAKLGPRLLRW